MSDLPLHQIMALWGFGLGAVFGAVTQRTNFCTMGALSDIVFLDSYVRWRIWLLAIATAIAGTSALALAGLIDPAKAIYATPNFGWLGAILGGLMFGFGMVLAGGCGSKTLVRLGSGNLKSLIVLLVLAIFAYMSLRGLIAAARVAFIEPSNLNLKAYGLQTQLLPEGLGRLTGLSSGLLQAMVPGVIVIALGVFCFKDAAFRANRAALVAGTAIGALVTAAWYVTGVIGDDEFDPVPLASFTFVTPNAEALQYLMTWSGAKISFGIATVFGVIVGAFVAAKAAGEFRIEGFTSSDDLVRHLGGAALMGTGGVLALGCTIGQGLTGLSTLSLGAFVSFLAICAGGIAGLRYLEHGALVPALKALLVRA